MKKKFIFIPILIVVLALAIILSACASNKAEIKEDTVISIEALVKPDSSFKVGDAFDKGKFEVYAVMSDKKTKRLIENQNSLVYNINEIKADGQNIVDADGKFSKAGEFTLKVTFSDKSTNVTIKVV